MLLKGDYVMINIGILIAIVFAVLIVGGTGFYFLVQSRKYKIVFRVWSRDLANSYLTKARIQVDKENKRNKVFVFKNNSTVLTMREAKHWENGKPIRWVTPDESGEFKYLSPASRPLLSKEVIDSSTGTSTVKAVDDARYLQTRMHPEDKQLMAEQMRNNMTRYQITDKAALASFMSLLALAAILGILLIYSAGVLVKNAKAVGETMSTFKETMASHDANTLKILESMRDVTNNLGYIYSQLNDDNVTVFRPVGGVTP